MSHQVSDDDLHTADLFNKFGGDIAAWSVAVDPFDLGLRIESYRKARPDIQRLYNAIKDPTSSLARAPEDIIHEIAKHLSTPSDLDTEQWMMMKRCCTLTCKHDLCEEKSCDHEPCKEHTMIENFFRDKVCYTDRIEQEARKARQVLWLDAVNQIEVSFGLRATITLVKRLDSKFPRHQTRYDAHVVLPVLTAPDFDRSRIGYHDTLDWILAATPSHLPQHMMDESVRKQLPQTFTRFLRTFGLTTHHVPVLQIFVSSIYPPEFTNGGPWGYSHGFCRLIRVKLGNRHGLVNSHTAGAIGQAIENQFTSRISPGGGDVFHNRAYDLGIQRLARK